MSGKQRLAAKKKGPRILAVLRRRAVAVRPEVVIDGVVQAASICQSCAFAAAPGIEGLPVSLWRQWTCSWPEKRDRGTFNFVTGQLDYRPPPLCMDINVIGSCPGWRKR